MQTAEPGWREAVPSAEADDGGLDIRGWLQTLRRHKVLIAAVVVIVVVATLFVLNDITPRYTASAKVLIETQDSNVMDFEAVMAGIGSDTAAVASQVEILTSRSLIGRVADELNLLEDPEFNPYRRPEPTGLAAFSLGDLVPDWLRQAFGFAEPEAVLGLEPGAVDQLELERTAVVNHLLEAIAVQPVRLTYVITLSATSTSPQKAARLANTVARLYILDQLEAKFEATEQANVWLGGRLEELRQQVIDAEALVTAYRIENNLGNDNSQSLIEQQLTQATAQLTLAQSELAAARANYDQVQQLLQSQGTNSAAQVLANPLIQQLRGQEADANRRLAELAARYGDLHPDIINAKAEIGDLRQTIEGEVAKIVQNLASEVAVAQARSASIAGTVSDLNQRFNSERGAGVKLRELERESEAARQLYETMLTRYKETSQQEEIQQPDARLISEAAVPAVPSFPKTNLILAMAGVLSLMGGVGLAFLLEHMRSGFRSLEHVEQVLGLPGLVEVPLLRRSERKKPHEHVLKKPLSPYAESVRSVQTALMLSNVDHPPQTVCLVSSVPEEGKSALTAALGRSAAQGGRRVLLVDCDLRRPQQHRILNAKRTPGLTELLSGKAAFDEVALVDDETGLTVLPAGAEVPNPANLLQSNKMAELIGELRERFDLIILDTPAIMALADGLVVTTLADTTMMLVQWERTPRAVALAAVRSLRAAGAKLAGVILSQVDQRKQATYGYSAYGYYYSRYKSYYSK